MNTVSFNATSWIEMVIQLINLTIVLAIIILCIYGIILFIKLIKRGIKALDIYIQKNQEDKQ